jgi:hypothetical protein
MVFQPSFAFWPRPQFLGGSRDGFAAWIIDREASPDAERDGERSATIHRIIDNHHERNGQTIEPSRPNDV